MKPFGTLLRRAIWVALAVVGSALLAGCEEATRLDHALDAIPAEMLAVMQEKGVTADAPILIRAYKQEAEFEVWKRKPDGRYVYLKTYPMCRWSGQLGPKRQEGDRQVPEGFYSITPAALNPNSSYYLSFDIGYPNAYDRAYGATGGHIMVHGICSSAGCFSMTNEQIGEIYAIAREAFNGGQRAIQLQSLPFRMSAKNLAKHRADPYMPFWQNLKEGADNFEVTKQEPLVGVCAKRYVFNAQALGRMDASEPCPRLREEPDVKADVAAKQKRDAAAVAELVGRGEKAVRLVYVDGGQHPVFHGKYADASRLEALAAGPTEIVMDDPPAKPIKAAKSIRTLLARDERPSPRRSDRMLADAPVDPSPTSAIVAAAPQAPAAEDVPLYKRLLGFSPIAPQTSAVAAAPQVVPAAPAPVADAAASAGQAEKSNTDGMPIAAKAKTPRTRSAAKIDKPKLKPHKDEADKVVEGAPPSIHPAFQALAHADH